jgi:histidinol-phosphate aminotransferase
MTDFSQFVPAHPPPAEGVRPGHSNNQRSAKPIALNLNNPFGPSPLALKAIAAALRRSSLSRNSATELHDAIAAFGVNSDQVLVTAGRQNCCAFLPSPACAWPQRHHQLRSFIVYKLATQVTEGRLIEIATRDNGYDLDAIADIDANTRIIFIANPNNPTGTLVTATKWTHSSRVPDHVLVVLMKPTVLRRGFRTKRDVLTRDL